MFQSLILCEIGKFSSYDDDFYSMDTANYAISSLKFAIILYNYMNELESETLKTSSCAPCLVPELIAAFRNVSYHMNYVRDGFMKNHVKIWVF